VSTLNETENVINELAALMNERAGEAVVLKKINQWNKIPSDFVPPTW